ncbi:hypothetical protein QP093_03775 [Pauljensenia sp. UMB10120]|uniref:hypothetical protein n=1 Tax=Pauljensenia sp. UMB10120 TaxID=3046356 RepID=UPI00254AAF24|nr:hypothetical protein [Pauljensenia sp. UMB10120]MDK6242654.1 hypothetical protein [Pauljensenia sp. UMB10120]
MSTPDTQLSIWPWRASQHFHPDTRDLRKQWRQTVAARSNKREIDTWGRDGAGGTGHKMHFRPEKG